MIKLENTGENTPGKEFLSKNALKNSVQFLFQKNARI